MGFHKSHVLWEAQGKLDALAPWTLFCHINARELMISKCPNIWSKSLRCTINNFPKVAQSTVLTLLWKPEAERWRSFQKDKDFQLLGTEFPKRRPWSLLGLVVWYLSAAAVEPSAFKKFPVTPAIYRHHSFDLMKTCVYLSADEE